MPRRRLPRGWQPGKNHGPEATVIDTAAESGLADGLPPDPVRLALEAIRPHGPEHVWRPTRPYMAPD
jgi:hypothetical protein